MYTLAWPPRKRNGSFLHLSGIPGLQLGSSVLLEDYECLDGIVDNRRKRKMSGRAGVVDYVGQVHEIAHFGRTLCLFIIGCILSLS
jgi:hypothetical protein